MNAYVIVGEAATRKTSVIRCLTGCCNGKNQIRDIAPLKGNPFAIYVRAASLQEIPLTTIKFQKEVESGIKNHANCKTVLFCLRVNKVKAFPDALDYLSKFKENGWSIVKIAVFGDNAAAAPFKQYKPKKIKNSRTDPINKTAKAVRDYFGWE